MHGVVLPVLFNQLGACPSGILEVSDVEVMLAVGPSSYTGRLPRGRVAPSHRCIRWPPHKCKDATAVWVFKGGVTAEL